MSKNMNQVKCPNCGELIDVEEALTRQIESDVENRYKSELKEKLKAITAREAALKDSEKKNREILEEELTKREKELRENLDQELKKDYEKKINFLMEDLTKKDNELSGLKDKEIELEKLKREKSIMEKDFELKLEKEKNRLQAEIEERVVKMAEEKNELVLKEKDKKIEDAQKQVAELERKLKQGSSQLQGEVQELAIEEVLSALFPEDEVKPVPKGKAGADCVLVVRAEGANAAGKIIYESKRTKSFSGLWVEKLKDDQRNEKADIAVLVTETMPKDMENIGNLDGIWICSFQLLKPLSLALRDGILKVYTARTAQKNSGDKMNMLYDFLTSNEFKMQIEAILEGFLSLKQSMEREKLAMEKLWKEREKQLNKVLMNTTHFYASIKGIAGSGVPEISLLEFRE